MSIILARKNKHKIHIVQTYSKLNIISRIGLSCYTENDDFSHAESNSPDIITWNLLSLVNEGNLKFDCTD